MLGLGHLGRSPAQIVALFQFVASNPFIVVITEKPWAAGSAFLLWLCSVPPPGLRLPRAGLRLSVRLLLSLPLKGFIFI